MKAIASYIRWAVVVCAVFVSQSAAQPVQSISTPRIDLSSSGVIWFLLVFLFSLAYGVPILCWVYRVLIRKLVQKASRQIESWSMRISERISGAGRKLSETMRA
jgi:hypothetical protein